MFGFSKTKSVKTMDSFLLVVEAKKEWPDSAMAQVLVEAGCLLKKRLASGNKTPVFAVLTNGQLFRFFCIDVDGVVYSSGAPPIGLGPGPSGDYSTSTSLSEILRWFHWFLTSIKTTSQQASSSEMTDLEMQDSLTKLKCCFGPKQPPPAHDPKGSWAMRSADCRYLALVRQMVRSSQMVKTTGIADLPHEILLAIVQHLHMQSYCRLLQTCSALHQSIPAPNRLAPPPLSFRAFQWKQDLMVGSAWEFLVICGFYDLCYWLIKRHDKLLDPTIKDLAGREIGWTVALSRARIDLDLIRKLVKNPASHPSVHQLEDAARLGSLETVDLLLNGGRFGPAVNHSRAFELACDKGYTEIVARFLKQPEFDPTLNQEFYLYLACKRPHLDILALLVKDERINAVQGLISYLGNNRDPADKQS
ncbi:hypothetical protein HDU91_002732, partial [Kappamyces sp. JEL0680]